MMVLSKESGMSIVTWVAGIGLREITDNGADMGKLQRTQIDSRRMA